jgi:tRNA(Ile)-lysidine synthetase-like protein
LLISIAASRDPSSSFGAKTDGAEVAGSGVATVGPVVDCENNQSTVGSAGCDDGLDAGAPPINAAHVGSKTTIAQRVLEGIMLYYIGMTASPLQNAIANLPPGKYAVGVSGGADSVALLLLLHERPDVALHVAHLNHQTRGEETDTDAAFVASLAERLNIPSTIARRDAIEPSISDLPGNPSAKYRRVRIELFRRVIDAHNLDGVILAHHADDQVETVLQRLARGSGVRGLSGMRQVQEIDGIKMFRPLIQMSRNDLREYLKCQHQKWCEDSSNRSDLYSRNRARKLLSQSRNLTPLLLELAGAAEGYLAWVRANDLPLKREFEIQDLAREPLPLARETACAWLIRAGVPAAELNSQVIDRLIEMARDAATAPRQQFHGEITIRRRAGRIAPARL